MFPYPALLDASRNPFSSRKRVSGRLLPAEQAAEDGGLSGHMRILDTRLARIRQVSARHAGLKSGDFSYDPQARSDRCPRSPLVS